MFSIHSIVYYVLRAIVSKASASLVLTDIVVGAVANGVAIYDDSLIAFSLGNRHVIRLTVKYLSINTYKTIILNKSSYLNW